MAHQIDLFRVPQLPDAECFDADHNGSSAQQGRLAIPLLINTQSEFLI
jgi:hypothetical protein